MWITVIADASYCPETGKGGYGYWIASRRGKVGGDGVLPVDPVSNIAAEMMAMLIAMHHAEMRGLLKKKDNVLLQTDCYPAIDTFQGNRKTISQQEEQLVEFYKEFVSTHQLHMRLKHVKGHTENSEARFVSNRICDLRARQNMRKARDEYRDQMIKEFLNDR